MGVDREIYKNGKHVCSLGRAYHFKNLIDDEYITQFKMSLVAQMLWSDDPDELWVQVTAFNENLDYFIEECRKLGASALVDYMVEDGLSVVDE